MDRDEDSFHNSGSSSNQPGNGLILEGPPFDLENIPDYEAGGHHPVHLGDCIDARHYRVIHKLDSGGLANVWLCRDLETDPAKYVAVKILMADASTEDCRELQGLRRFADWVDAKEEIKQVCMPFRHCRVNGPTDLTFLWYSRSLVRAC